VTTNLDYEFDLPEHERDNRKPARPGIITAEKKRPKTAQDYEAKIASALHTAMKSTAESEATVADAAAIIRYGPKLAEKAGDLANHDPRVRKAIDLITAPDNPYLAMAMAAIPLVVQIARNHETKADTEVSSRELRIPFLKSKKNPEGRKFRLRFGIRVRNKWLRSMTEDPRILARDVFSDPEIKKALEDRDIRVAL